MRTPALVFLSLLLATTVSAQTTPPDQTKKPPAAAPAPFPEGAKFAFVNLQLIITQSKTGQAGLAQLQKTQETLDAKLQAMAKELQDLQAKYTAQQGLLAADALRGMEVDIERKQRSLQFETQTRDADLERLGRDLLDGLNARVLPIVDGLRKERGLWAVFGARPEPGGLDVVAADPGLDISLDVIKRLDAEK